MLQDKQEQQQQQQEQQQNTKADKIKLLTQGSYGCIYKPGLTCKGKLDSKQFIRKIQKEDAISFNEKTIGDLIKKIRNYKQYFAPVVDSCPISIGVIENEEIKNCNITKDTKAKYISYKIRYVGKKSLSNYLLQVFEKSPNMFLKMLFTSNIDLLDEISLLYENNIIHMDLKENNIMFDDNLSKPICIDFGLSFNKSKLTDSDSVANAMESSRAPSNMKQVFYIYEDYPPWCFEINCINYLLHIHKGDNNTIQPSDLDSICIKFIEHNKMLHSFFDKNDIDEYNKKLISFIHKFNGKKVKDIINELLGFSNTWDNYSIAVLYFDIMKINGLYKNIEYTFLKEYIDLLKGVILASPDERKSINDTKNIILKLAQNIKVNDKLMLNGKIAMNSKNDDFIKKMNNTISQNKLDLLTKQDYVYKYRVEAKKKVGIDMK